MASLYAFFEWLLVSVVVLGAIFFAIPWLLQYYAGMISTGYWRSKMNILNKYKLNKNGKEEQEEEK